MTRTMFYWKYTDVSPKRFVNFYHTTRRHVSENSILQSSECVSDGTLTEIDVCGGIEDIWEVGIHWAYYMNLLTNP